MMRSHENLPGCAGAQARYGRASSVRSAHWASVIGRTVIAGDVIGVPGCIGRTDRPTDPLHAVTATIASMANAFVRERFNLTTSYRKGTTLGFRHGDGST
jgi:hypothetical protein